MCAILKNEDTWCRALGHLRCRVRFSLESIQWAVARRRFTHSVTRTVTSTCVIRTGLFLSGADTARLSSSQFKLWFYLASLVSINWGFSNFLKKVIANMRG